MMLMVRWPAPPRLRPPEFAEEEEENDGGGGVGGGSSREREKNEMEGRKLYIYL